MGKTASSKVTITNKLGLHARPAMLFVETASKYDADVSVRRCDQNNLVDGKSIMQMMMLACTQGTHIEIRADGEDAEKAIDSLIALVKSNFQEE